MNNEFDSKQRDLAKRKAKSINLLANYYGLTYEAMAETLSMYIRAKCKKEEDISENWMQYVPDDFFVEMFVNGGGVFEGYVTYLIKQSHSVIRMDVAGLAHRIRHKDMLTAICDTALCRFSYGSSVLKDMQSFYDAIVANNKKNDFEGWLKNYIIAKRDSLMVHERLANLKSMLQEYEQVTDIATEYANECAYIQKIFHFSDDDMYKIRYSLYHNIALALKNGSSSEGKILYIYGEKGFGKTMFATALACAVNGDPLDVALINNNKQFTGQHTTKLKVEMQRKTAFDVPATTTGLCCVIDEALSEGIPYADIKEYFTSPIANVNRKFLAAEQVEAIPNIIFTSNDPISKFIKDDSDRRYLMITMCQKSTKLPNMVDFYKHVRKFVALSYLVGLPHGCMDDFDWYNQFESEVGESAINKSERELEMIMFLESAGSPEFICKNLKTSNNTLKSIVGLVGAKQYDTQDIDIVREILREWFKNYGSVYSSRNGVARYKREEIIEVFRTKIASIATNEPNENITGIAQMDDEWSKVEQQNVF